MSHPLCSPRICLLYNLFIQVINVIEFASGLLVRNSLIPVLEFVSPYIVWIRGSDRSCSLCSYCTLSSPLRGEIDNSCTRAGELEERKEGFYHSFASVVICIKACHGIIIGLSYDSLNYTGDLPYILLRVDQIPNNVWLISSWMKDCCCLIVVCLYLVIEVLGRTCTSGGGILENSFHRWNWNRELLIRT